MKKASLLLLAGALLSVFACQQPAPEAVRDGELTGEKVDVSALPAGIRKVFVLNEGGMGSNNATLDLLRISDGNYITAAFRKMNAGGIPGVAAVETGPRLGDVGNDIAVRVNEAWIVVNNSGIVEVVSATDEKELAAIRVPTPRNIAFDDKYAYVSSWAGAYANGGYDSDFNYVITDYKNPKGQVYRINLTTRQVEGSVEVGYQPEGLVVCNGKLYVANSGGIASQLPPDYAYDKTVSIIDTKTFTVTKTVDVQVNLKNVWADSKGNVYVTCLGNYFNVHSGLYMIDASDAVKHVGDYVGVSAMQDDTVYCIGAEEEFDWYAPKTWKAWSCKDGVKTALNWTVNATTPYGLCVFDANTYLLCDAGDYFNPGSVSLYAGGAKKWTVTAGVCPGHFAIW